MSAAQAADRIAHYRLERLLGQGAMGEVWLAEDIELPRHVAIKLLHPAVSEDEQAVARLTREAQAAASIDHPAVVTVYEAGRANGRPYVVMQRLEGETLQDRMDRGPLSTDEMFAIALPITDALAEVHALGIVHRDLKPSNVMLTTRGPKLLDFGVASVKSLPRLTSPGTLVGTPLILSPEQIRGLPPDNRTDLWALGVILYEMLTGVHPFAGSEPAEILQRILEHEPVPPGKLVSGRHPDLDHSVMKLLRKDTQHRYARAEDLLADLESCRAQQAGRTIPSGTSRAPLRLTVLPFEVMSADPDDAYIAAGLAEDLIVDLARVRALDVTSRAEITRYADRKVPPRTLSRELGVDYVLTGSVRRAGNRARISAQLVRGADGHLLWAERFDRTLEDLFDVQVTVSRLIVDALQIALTPTEREILDRVPTQVTEAYTLYLRARDLLLQSPESNRHAERLLLQAINLDEEFALAHSTLGECLAQGGLRWWRSAKVADQALGCAKRALELDPGQPDALYAQLLAKRLGGKPNDVLEVIDRFLQTNPNARQPRLWAAWSYMSLGRPLEALPILEDLQHKSGMTYERLMLLRNCYDMLGRRQDARRTAAALRDELVETVRRDPDLAHPRSLLAVSLVEDGDVDAGLALAERAVALSPDDPRCRYNAACAYTAAGRTDQAVGHLEQAVGDLRDYASDWVSRDPDLAALRDHPRFVELFGTSED